MRASERRNAIIAMLHENNFIKMSDIVSMFDVSNETARRDLDYLQDQKIVRRVYGGAIMEGQALLSNKIPRPSMFNNEIDAIGKAAAEMVKPGEAVFIGPGSTALQVARHLRTRSNITVVTNSLAVATELVSSDVTTYIFGGLLNCDEQDIRGELVRECASHFFFDKAFFGCGGVTLDLGVMDFSSTHTPIHSQVVNRANQRILVASSKKFGTPAFLSACSLKDINVVITDIKIPELYYSSLKDMGIKLILVEADLSTTQDFED